MIIHYQDDKGEEVFLRNVMHIQNIDNEEWEAITEQGEVYIMRTGQIEGVADIHEQSGVTGPKEVE